jgi:hypothetical protein
LTDRSWVDWDAPPRPYPAAFCVFFHALRVGLPWDVALSRGSRLIIIMSASTRPIFTIAGCALSLAAVGTIALCLVVLL